jgi:4-amino-4-deoxy-L-arabinose transferase-like glycosyltransferase
MTERVAAEPTRPLPRSDRRTWWIDAAVLAAGAILLRIPAFVASRHLTYDDGFFGLSALEMRDGVVPFKELFSPQGPLHLPLLYLADLAGFRTTNAPRVLPMVAGVAITVVTYAAGRRITSRFGALVAAVLVTTSGSIVWVTTGIASDGPALAFAIGAVAVAFGYTHEARSGRAVAAGALLGAAVAAKALAAPAGLAVALLLLSRRRPRDLAYAGGAAIVVALGAALPWGLERVWDQSVAYNRNASRLTSYWGAVTKAWHTLVDRDPLLLVAVGLVLVMLALSRLGWVRATDPPPSARGPVLFRPVTALVIWLATQFALLVYEPAFWRPHVAFLIAPLALLV